MSRPRLSPYATVSAVILFFILVACFGAPWWTPYSFERQDPKQALAGPSPEHLMGTDRLGRDLFSRLLYGGRVSMMVGLLTALAALGIGTLYGAISAYVGGRTDNLMMRAVDVVYALPDLLLIILLMVLIGRGVTGVVLALSTVSWVVVARLIRGEVLRLKRLPFVEAARAAGAGDRRILFRHILPNTMGPLIVTLTFRIPAAILAESTLSFIGLGIAPPAASWGTLANEGWAAMKFYPHLILFPAVTLFVTMLAFNTLGDGLRDALDPRRRVT